MSGEISNVPSTKRPLASVPSTEAPKSSVPSTQAPKSNPPATVPLTPAPKQRVKGELVVPGLERNARVDTGQKLGVIHWDGTTREIEDRHRPLAIVAGRILDRAPWSALEIVTLD